MFKWVKSLFRKVTGASCVEDVQPVDELISLAQIAKELDITYNVAYYCIITRGAPKYDISGRWFVKRREFRAWHRDFVRGLK